MVEYSDRCVIPWATVGTYVFLTLLVLALWRVGVVNENLALLLTSFLGLYLARLLSLTYRISDGKILALRLFGSRRERLKDVRKVELVSLRDLSPVSMLGGWGWRSRMWSPRIGKFDNLSTWHLGLLVYAGDAPFFISPRDREGFLQELNKSCGGKLLEGN